MHCVSQLERRKIYENTVFLTAQARGDNIPYELLELAKLRKLSAILVSFSNLLSFS